MNLRYPSFRFRLISLMLIVALAATVYGWWRRTSLEQQRAISVIASKGGYVWLDRAGNHVDIEFGVPRHKGCGQIVLLAGPQTKSPSFSDVDVRVIDKIWWVRAVSFLNSDVSSETIKQFRRAHPQCVVDP
jgi:hypothetical protein